jgi:MFS family permease
MGKRVERNPEEVKEEKEKLYSGAMFGFLQETLMAFSIVVPAFYFSAMDISIAVYGFLLTIGDVFSFLAKPFIGYYTDKHGERKFLLSLTFFFFFSLYLIGKTTSVPVIAFLKVIAGIASALLFVVIIIYGLRLVEKRPDKKVGFFGAVKAGGWVPGLLIPGLLIDKLGVGPAFDLILVLGLVWIIYMFYATKKYERVRGLKVKPSLKFLRKIPVLVIYKTMDLAMFSAFLFYFTRFALKELGLGRGIISTIVVVETIAFSVSNFLIGRVSNKRRRKYWVPFCILAHIIGIIILINAKTILDFFMASIFLGVAGGFIDVWLFSRISETVKKYDKGVFYGTFGWSYDLATIVGGQIPVLFVSLGLNVFASMFVFPGIMLVCYLLSKKKD